jgi:hypothetical protein
MREIIRVWNRYLRRGRARDHPVERRVIELAGNKEGASHLVEMGHEAADGRDEGVGVVDLDGIDTADVPIDQVRAGERQFPINGLPTIEAIRTAQDAALIK